MKTLLLASLFSFSAFSATVDLNCIGGTVAVNGDDISVEKILLQERISVEAEKGVIILVSADSMEVIADDELSPEDNGKTILVLAQNIDSEGKDPIGLNIIKAKIDLEKADGIEMTNLTQVGDINNVNIVEMDFREKYALKCENAQ